ncbi:hypothetical protein GDO78_022292 [Eleutherodactylus coqui]|uniref:Uncharacterized protein n=1 Tax=Eleutherodactylus coqui TaxID=57060 RepID=A0A8J6B4S7_ELECQ|nr:hypothetical protein GDO78_022292 [Eleutherodactylus coqui]
MRSVKSTIVATCMANLSVWSPIELISDFIVKWGAPYCGKMKPGIFCFGCGRSHICSVQVRNHWDCSLMEKERVVHLPTGYSANHIHLVGVADTLHVDRL